MYPISMAWFIILCAHTNCTQQQREFIAQVVYIFPDALASLIVYTDVLPAREHSGTYEVSNSNTENPKAS